MVLPSFQDPIFRCCYCRFGGREPKQQWRLLAPAAIVPVPVPGLLPGHQQLLPRLGSHRLEHGLCAQQRPSPSADTTLHSLTRRFSVTSQLHSRFYHCGGTHLSRHQRLRQLVYVTLHAPAGSQHFTTSPAGLCYAVNSCPDSGSGGGGGSHAPDPSQSVGRHHAELYPAAATAADPAAGPGAAQVGDCHHQLSEPAAGFGGVWSTLFPPHPPFSWFPHHLHRRHPHTGEAQGKGDERMGDSIFEACAIENK